MEALAQILGWALITIALCGVAVTLAAAALLRLPTSPSSAQGAPRNPAPVTLLKPLYLAEPGLEENLLSFFQQDHQAPIQIVFGVHGNADPALNVVEKLKSRFPNADVEVVVDSTFVGTNPKVANLINMTSHAKHEILVISDSDIRVKPDYVRHIAAAVDRAGRGAVTCFYAGRPIGNVWSVLAAMGIDYQFLPNVAFGVATGLAQPCFGSTIALRRAVLREIGGFEALSGVLADDYELGRSVRRNGGRVWIAAMAVEHLCYQRTARQLIHQELRWSKTNLMLAPWGYLGSAVTYPLPFALLAFLCEGPSALFAAVVAAALASRVLVAFRSRRALGSAAGSFWLLPLRDMLSFGIFVAAFFGKSTDWRGTRYLTGPRGALARL